MDHSGGKRQQTSPRGGRSVRQRTPPPRSAMGGDGHGWHGADGGRRESDGAPWQVVRRDGGGEGRGGGGSRAGGAGGAGGGGPRIFFHTGAGRAIGAGKGREQDIMPRENQERVFCKIIKDSLKAPAFQGLEQLCKLMCVGRVDVQGRATEIDNLANMNVIHVSTAVDSLGKILEKGMSGRVPGALERTINVLADGVVSRLEPGFAANPRALASVLHGLALIHGSGHSSIASREDLRGSLMRHIATLDDHNIASPNDRDSAGYRPWDMTQVLWGFAKLGWFRTRDETSAKVLDSMDRLCSKSLDRSLGNGGRSDLKFDGVDLCNLLQALALIENACGLKVSEDLLKRMEVQAGNQAHTLEFAQGVVTTVTGLAKLERDPPNVVKAQLCVQALKRMGKANGQDISNLMWGMAKMGWHPPPQLLDLLYGRMLETVQMFNRQEIVNMFWATAILNVRMGPGDKHWEKMTWRLQQVIPDFIAQDMSMVFHASGLMGEYPPGMLERLLEYLPQVLNGNDCTPQNVTQIFRALAILQVPVPAKVLDSMQGKAGSLMHIFNAQDVAGVYWSFATMKQRPDAQLMQSMAKRVVSIQADLNAQDLSLIAWSINTGSWHLSESEKEEEEDLLLSGGRLLRRSAAGTSSAYDPSLVMGALEERACAIMHKLMPRDYASVFWAVTRLGTGFTNFFMTLCEGLECSVSDWQRQDMGRTGEMDPRDVAQILQALAMNHTCLDENIVDHHGRQRLRKLLDTLLQMCLCLIPRFNAADLSGGLSAAVHLDWTSTMQDELMTNLLGHAVHVAHELDGRCLSEVVWAVARTGRDLDDKLLHVVSERAKDLLDSVHAQSKPDIFRPRDIATFMWALAKLRVQPDPSLSTRLNNVVSAHVEHFKPSHLAQILWSAACAQVVPAPDGSSARRAYVHFRNSVLGRIKELAGDFRTTDVTTVLWSLVVMSDDDDFFCHDAFRDDFRQVVGQFALRIEDVFAAMQGNECIGEEQRARSPRSPRSRLDNELDRSDMCMLHQFFLSCAVDQRFSQAVGAPGCDMHRVRQLYEPRCKKAFLETLSAASDTQKRVRDVMVNHMHLNVDSEFRCERSGYSIDMRATSCTSPAVWYVEVNGPSHYFAGQNRGKLGATRLKERHFELLGHQLVTVPYWDWDLMGYRFFVLFVSCAVVWVVRWVSLSVAALGFCPVRCVSECVEDVVPSNACMCEYFSLKS